MQSPAPILAAIAAIAAPAPTATAGARATEVWAVGDGADGSATARRLAQRIRRARPDRFFYLGDVYESGTRAEFARNYHPLYGPLARITDPVIGNHEMRSDGAGYDAYWRVHRGWSRTRARHRAYVDRSGWQVIAYDSEADPAREARWIARRLAEHDGRCRIAVGHRGRHVVADDEHGDNRDQAPVWRALAGRVTINLVAHNHLYGRLAPIDGVHVVVSGAGGHELRAPGRQRHDVAAVVAGAPSATRIDLRPGSARLRQIDARGRVRDAATFRC